MIASFPDLPTMEQKLDGGKDWERGYRRDTTLTPGVDDDNIMHGVTINYIALR